jgi:hypothetical protein
MLSIYLSSIAIQLKSIGSLLFFKANKKWSRLSICLPLIKEGGIFTNSSVLIQEKFFIMARDSPGL